MDDICKKHMDDATDHCVKVREALWDASCYSDGDAKWMEAMGWMAGLLFEMAIFSRLLVEKKREAMAAGVKMPRNSVSDTENTTPHPVYGYQFDAVATKWLDNESGGGFQATASDGGNKP